MKKEVFFAIIIGIILGLIAMFGLDSLKNGNLPLKPKNDSVKETPVSQETNIYPTPTVNATKENKQEFSLEILQPEDETVSPKGTIDLKGKTKPLATVVVIWEEGEDILVADEQGIFETQIDLSAGPNEIQISAYDDQDNVVKKILTVTYSTAKF